MAIVAYGTTAMIFGFTDRDKNTATLTLYSPAAAVTEDVSTWASTTGATLVQNLSNAKLSSISIIQRYVNDDLTPPVEASDVERKAVFSYDVDGGGVSTFRVPSIINEKVVDGTKFINPADAAVIAFQAAMIDAGLFDVYGLGNFRGSKLLVANGAPYKSHKGSENG